MLNTRENYMATLTHDPAAEYVPDWITSIVYLGGDKETFENGPAGGGLDGFGVKWAVDAETGQGVPEANRFVLKDIDDWKDVVKFPDLDAYDWKGQAEAQLANYNPDMQVAEYHSWNSQFLRVTHLMGFEEGLCAFYEDPDAVKDMMEAITDYKIKLIERVHEYFHPDVFCNYDDVATARNLFISPEIYRETVKPCHKRMNDAAKAYGMIPMQHTCGKCEDLIGDFIEEGSVAWQSAQPMNDIEKIIETYGDRFTVIGGYDTQGPAGQADATPEMIQEEVKRCIETYGRFHKGYMFCGFLIGKAVKNIPILISAAEKEIAENAWGK